MGPEIFGRLGHLTSPFRRCSQYRLRMGFSQGSHFFVTLTLVFEICRSKNPRASLCRRTPERTPHAASPRERIVSNVSSGTSRVSSFAARRCRERGTTGSTRATARMKSAGCFAFDRGFASSFARLTLPPPPSSAQIEHARWCLPAPNTHPLLKEEGTSRTPASATAAASLRSVPWIFPSKHARATAYVQYDSSTRAGDVVARHATKRDSSVRPH